MNFTKLLHALKVPHSSLKYLKNYLSIRQYSKESDSISDKSMNMDANAWIKRWEDDSKIRRWEISGVHPFLTRHLPSSTSQQRILVPLAGKTVDSFWLAENHYRVVAVECSAKAIEEVLDENLDHSNYRVRQISEQTKIYETPKKELTFICCDIFSDELNSSVVDGHVDLIWDRAALSALHPRVHKSYIDKLKCLAAKNAQFLFSVYWHSGPIDRDPPYPITKQDISQLFHGYNVVEIDEIDSMNDQWKTAGYEDLCERFYLIEKDSSNK